MSSDRNMDAEIDIYQLLTSATKKSERNEILETLGIQEFFSDGKITINTITCRGTECNLCIDACPTHALYWKAGEIDIEEVLCVYCTACVLSCIVDDCINVQRQRPSGEEEEFSKPKHVQICLQQIATNKRVDRTRSILERKTEEQKLLRFTLSKVKDLG